MLECSKEQEEEDGTAEYERSSCFILGAPIGLSLNVLFDTFDEILLHWGGGGEGGNTFI